MILATIVGQAPVDVAVDPVTNRVYLANQRSNSVAVIDGATNTVVDAIAVSFPEAVAVNPKTNRVYVASGLQLDNDLVVIDGSSDQVVATIPWDTRRRPDSLAVDPVRNRVYAASAEQLLVVDGATNEIVTRLQIEDPARFCFNCLAGVAVDTRRDRVYVGNVPSAGLVAVLDGASDQVLTTIRTTGREMPGEIAVDEQANRIYALPGPTVVSGNGYGILAQVPAAAPGASIAVDPGTSRIYVWVPQDLYLIVLDGSTGATIATLDAMLTGINPPRGTQGGVALDPDRQRLYVVTNGGFAAVIDTGVVRAPAIAAEASATSVTARSATLSGAVVPRGASTTVSFEYGTTAAYGQRTSAQTLPASSASQAVTASLAGLAPDATYHVRLVAQNSGGTATGADQTFTTPAAQPAADTAPPRVQALASRGARGRLARLLFRVWEDSGRARDRITIRGGSTRLGAVAIGLRREDGGATYSVSWRVPANAQGPLRFCVVAEDPSGNRSAPSCAPLTLAR